MLYIMGKAFMKPFTQSLSRLLKYKATRSTPIHAGIIYSSCPQMNRQQLLQFFFVRLAKTLMDPPIFLLTFL